MRNGSMKIIVTESEDFSEVAIEKLSSLGALALLNVTERKELLEQTKKANVLFVRLRFYIDRAFIDNAPHLNYILTATTGLDHIDVPYFEARGGTIISLKGEFEFLRSIPSTAEHTWGLLLALMRNTSKAFEDVKNGYWRRDLFKGNNLKGKKLGILGMGRVGSQVAKYGIVFDMQVGYYDVVKKEDKSYKSFTTAKQLFEWADVISIHIPLNKENIQFINSELLNQLSKESVLINTSRGAVVDELYICELLVTKRLKGYATDVIESEMQTKDCLTNVPLIALAKEDYNVLITPHIAGATYESMEMTEEFITAKFIKQLHEK